MATNPKNKRQQPKKDRYQDRFIVAYADCGNLSEAARIVGCNRCNHYKWLSDPEYVKRFNDAQEQAIEHLEEVARKRAEKQSDTLLIFLLKSLRPERYRERKEVEHNVNINRTEHYVIEVCEKEAKEKLEKLNSGINRLKNVM